ncbi:unnamed protein product [Toxocara canis]|uniref:Glutamine amidotransferase type-2 domain-containing protein n=1 Tax=Toxocara canis TaxID=6265 RepID=A0A183U398_TOXCA|nr:unnamed protein product [Toxocara canis]
MAFSDGRYVGAILDRNGLRPARYYLTDDDHLYLSSEVGVIDLPVSSIIKKVGHFHQHEADVWQATVVVPGIIMARQFPTVFFS